MRGHKPLRRLGGGALEQELGWEAAMVGWGGRRWASPREKSWRRQRHHVNWDLDQEGCAMYVCNLNSSLFSQSLIFYSRMLRCPATPECCGVWRCRSVAVSSDAGELRLPPSYGVWQAAVFGRRKCMARIVPGGRKLLAGWVPGGRSSWREQPGRSSASREQPGGSSRAGEAGRGQPRGSSAWRTGGVPGRSNQSSAWRRRLISSMPQARSRRGWSEQL
jgi:hypothetical protein